MYYYAGGSRVAMQVIDHAGGTSGVYYLYADHLGSTTVTADETGAPNSTLLYKAWGETRASTGDAPTDYGYTGQREDQSINLMWYGSRWYDPYLSRWTSPDSIVPDIYIPQDWDRYAYVRNNPVNSTDPTGHKECDYKCQVEYQNADPTKEYYGGGVEPDYAAQKKNQEIAETILFDGTEFAASILSEPVDWGMTAYHCIEGDCSPWVLLGLLPLIPSSAANKINEVVDAVKKMDGVKLPVDDALDLATEFLGKDYIPVGNDRLVSADGLRQVRMGIDDLLGLHPFSHGPHINFEILQPKPGYPGHNQIIQNIHILIYEVSK